jgi:hypothetical protein
VTAGGRALVEARDLSGREIALTRGEARAARRVEPRVPVAA